MSKEEKYKDYIEGDTWLLRSKEYLKEHNICEICHKHKATQVHHNNYANTGNEPDEDLTAICERCHYHLHSMPPTIENPEQLKKAIKLLEDFRNYPRLKTLVMNEVSDKFFNGKFMIVVANEVAPKTAFFLQNVLEIWYNYGLTINEDIIEFATKTSYGLKMKAGKNKWLKELNAKRRKNAYERGELEIINIRATTTIKREMTQEIKEFEFKKNFILHLLRDNRETLARAKSHANVNYYNSLMYFNREGYYTPEQFFLKLKKDGFIDQLFVDMGGELPDKL